MNSSLLFDPFISNIQEIIDIEWLFELISMFLSIFIYLISLFILITNDQKKEEKRYLTLLSKDHVTLRYFVHF